MWPNLLALLLKLRGLKKSLGEFLAFFDVVKFMKEYTLNFYIYWMKKKDDFLHSIHFFGEGGSINFIKIYAGGRGKDKVFKNFLFKIQIRKKKKVITTDNIDQMDEILKKDKNENS